MASHLLSHLQQWLVNPQLISNFQWQPNITFGASVPFITTIIISYLSFTLLFHHNLIPLPIPSPSTLHIFSSIHNLILLFLSFTMALGCTISSYTQMHSPSWLFCFPLNTQASGPTFFWAYIFYMSKMYELLDTLLILLAGHAGRRRLTFLHVYHHAVVLLMCYVWLSTVQSLMPIALVTNAFVHVVMYGYYLSSSLGWQWRPRWKRAVTELQIVQFVFSFVASTVFLWLYFWGDGCEGMKGWVFNAVFNVSLLGLFVNFHGKAYEKRKRDNAAGSGPKVGGES